SDVRCMLGVRKTTPQQMTRVRRDRWQRTLVAVERQRECAELLEPKSIDDLGAKTLGFDAKTDRRVRVAGTIEQLGGAYLRVVDVALYLDEGNGRFGQSPIGEGNAIARVLPSLVHQTARRGARVFDEAVPVDIAVAIDPLERAPRIR